METLVSVLLIAGGLNWGSIGAGQGDLVKKLVGGDIANYVYLAVGLAALKKASKLM